MPNFILDHGLIISLGGGWGLGINQDKDNLNLMELLGLCKNFPPSVSIFLKVKYHLKPNISRIIGMENFPGLLA